MVAVTGTYQNGYVKLDKEYKTDNPVKVVVTFLQDVNTGKNKTLSFSDFSFDKSRENLKNFKGSLSDVLIEERRLEL